MTTRPLGATACAIAVLMHWSSASAFELMTHAAMTERAVAKSIISTPTFALRLGISPADFNELGLQYYDVSGSIVRQRKASDWDLNFFQPTFPKINGAIGWVIRGAVREDDAKFSSTFPWFGEPGDDTDPWGITNRFCNHFYDPYHDSAFTPFCFGTAPVEKSPNWAIGTNDAFATPPVAKGGSGINHFTVFSARELMFRALTLQNAAGGTITNATDATGRRKDVLAYWASTFRALGDIVHLVEDLGQPQHTRNESHGTGHAAIFEKYLNARSDVNRPAFTVDLLTLTRSQSTLRALDYEGADASGNGYPIPRLASYADYWSTARGNASISQGRGLADYTSRGFLTAGTSLGLSSTDFPSPSRSISDYASSFEPGLCDSTAQSVYQYEYLNKNVPDLTATGRDRVIRQNVRSIWKGTSNAVLFTVNHCIFDDVAALVAPRAVAYAAGVLDYFFRGRLEIGLPEEGVYGIIDRSTGGDAGFYTLRVKVKNITPDPTGQPGVDPMYPSEGSLYLVAKFHRNTCFNADLSGQYTSPGKTAQQCRSTVEEIVASNPAQVPIGINSTASSVKFIMNKPIPPEATDLYLQVIYRGRLGSEADAVVVETKDISEPTFLGYYDTTEQFGYGPSGDRVSWKKWSCDLQGIEYVQCKYNHRNSNYGRFSAPTAWDSANPIASFGATFSMLDVPVSASALVAVLVDPVPFTIWSIETRDPSNYTSGPVQPTIMQLDESTGNMVTTPSYSRARGIYADQYLSPYLLVSDPEAQPVPDINPLLPLPTQITFPNPQP